jgi:hypothetical protein
VGLHLSNLTSVKRFLKTLAILIVSLFLVASGVDKALDRMAKSPHEASFTIYNTQGLPVLAYNGNLSQLKAFARAQLFPSANVLHRG